MLKKVGNNFSNLTRKTGLKIKKHSPEILIAVGVTSIVGSAVWACCATLKAQKVIHEHKEKLEYIDYAIKNCEEGEYSEQDRKKDLTVAYVQTGVDLLKLYGPAILLGIGGIFCILGSHRIMRRREAAIIEALGIVTKQLTNYRKRVVEEYGKDKDYMFAHNLREETYEETETDENGKSKKVKKTKLVGEIDETSDYARFFDESCEQWSKNPEYNLMFIKSQQNYMNDMLKARGHVFLNEVYDALGMKRSQAGTRVGWVLDNPEIEGDNYIDFGIYDLENDAKRAFVNGYERSILLDFNVDGDIHRLI